jgi:cell division protein FtsI/penicillin-binding protein 2
MDSARQNQTYRRMATLAVFLAVFALIVILRLAYLQLWLPPYSPVDDRGTRNVAPRRGSIYDSNGYLLAVSTTVYDVGVLPRQASDKEVVADRLASLLGEPRSKMLAALEKELEPDENYVTIRRGVDKELAKIINGWGEPGVQAEARTVRYYPHGSLAVPVLGFVNEARQASHGVEARYDDKLAGKAGYRVSDQDTMGSLVYRYFAPEDGVDLYLTLDRNIQAMVEEALARGMTTTESKSGVVIVMDPRTGAILAMAVQPTFDPNKREEAVPGMYVNPAVSEPYEPGSVFKVFTIASALDAGVITPSSTYEDRGEIKLGGGTIKNSDGQAYGVTSIPDLLAYSLNVGAATVSTQMGAARFYEYVRRFGFSQLSGVDLARETAGWVRAPGNPEWHELDLGTNSFGQGLAATPLQVLTAICAVANHGTLMRPYVVARMVDGTTVTDTVPKVIRQAVSPEAAAETTKMLVRAVEHVRETVAIDGYSIAGKSGTSEISVASGGYDPNEVTASFAGWAPADDPRFAILVVLERPQKEHWGTQAAGPVFREIALHLLPLLGVPPDSVRLSTASLSGSGGH